ncbi:MAG: D-alanyl-D-alanine carboxypeptidase [Clostridiales bacterium]|nr:D-alanyl-D-alanine carboxypeptidase [Candidatus Crickella equi]
MARSKESNYKKSNRIKMRAIIIGLLLIIVLLFIIFTSGHKGEMIPCGDINAKAPDIRAKAAVLYSEDLDQVVYSKNADTQYAPYSITKLVTCYVATQELDKDEVVVISKRAANDSSEGSTMKLVPGEKVTVDQLLHGAMILSGNDAATALAEATCDGDIDAFVDEMNDTVADWGCKNTHFVNPTGWKAADHYTTANDLLTITQHVFDDEYLHKIATTRKYKMPKTNKFEARKMKTHITLTDKKKSGVLGGKSGFWSTSDCSVALEYNKNELTAILILLKDTDEGREEDVENLLKFAHKVTPGYVVDEAGADTGKVWVKHGKHTHVKTILEKRVHAYPKKMRKGKVRVKIHYDKVKAPLKKGTKVGTYEVYVSRKLVAKRNVMLAEDVQTGMILSNIYISDKVGIILVMTIVVLATALMLIRRYNRKQREKRLAALREKRARERSNNMLQ